MPGVTKSAGQKVEKAMTGYDEKSAYRKQKVSPPRRNDDRSSPRTGTDADSSCRAARVLAMRFGLPLDRAALIAGLAGLGSGRP
jgi:hypothetical protein